MRRNDGPSTPSPRAIRISSETLGPLSGAVRWHDSSGREVTSNPGTLWYSTALFRAEAFYDGDHWRPYGFKDDEEERGS